MKVHDKWNTDFFIWYDGGGAHVFGNCTGQHGDEIARWAQLTQKAVFFNTYTANNMFLNYPQGTQPYTDKVIGPNSAVLGGRMIFSKEAITTFRSVYEYILKWTLTNKHLNAEESIFVLMIHRYPYLVSAYGVWNTANNI